MECAKSLELLSDYTAGGLDESENIMVREHLSICLECDGVLKDLVLIVEAAAALRNTNGFQYPDENAVWQKLSLSKRTIH